MGFLLDRSSLEAVSGDPPLLLTVAFVAHYDFAAP